jgi:hypothetical protein
MLTKESVVRVERAGCSADSGAEPAAMPNAATACPPRWVVKLARFRADDDELLFAHMERCPECAAIFWGD